MLEHRDTTVMHRTIPVVAGLIGVACCLLALLDMRSQQAYERARVQPAIETMMGPQEPHHMRGWQFRRKDTDGATRRVEPVPPSLTERWGLS